MATRTLTAPLDGAITLGITAAQLELTVEVVPGLTTAQLELTGPDGIVDGTTEHTTAAAWYVDVPAPEPTVIQGGTITGGIHTRSGRTVINGTVDVDQARGDVTADTHNGAIFVGATGTRTIARTHNGAVDIGAASNGPITARTHNGPITVRTNGYDPDVRTHTHNGAKRIR